VTRNMSKQASALARARQPRRELDKTRDEQDQRVEQATAAALVALEVRTEAARGRCRRRPTASGGAVRTPLREHLSVERAAALLELDAGEVKRLTKPVAAEKPSTGNGGVPQVRLPEAALERWSTRWIEVVGVIREGRAGPCLQHRGVGDQRLTLRGGPRVP
jgi:hypothetical protein